MTATWPPFRGETISASIGPLNGGGAPDSPGMRSTRSAAADSRPSADTLRRTLALMAPPVVRLTTALRATLCSATLCHASCETGPRTKHRLDLRVEPSVGASVVRDQARDQERYQGFGDSHLRGQELAVRRPDRVDLGGMRAMASPS